MGACWDKQTIPSIPNGWIQWKGTKVCMDIRCFCGEQFHIDGTFTYYVKCLKCCRVYFCNGHIELIEADRKEAEENENVTSFDEDQRSEIEVEKWLDRTK